MKAANKETVARNVQILEAVEAFMERTDEGDKYSLECEEHLGYKHTFGKVQLVDGYIVFTSVDTELEITLDEYLEVSEKMQNRLLTYLK